MKKILYIFLLISTLSVTFTSCTEENVQPKTNEGPIGSTNDDKKG
jgi:hypothetical protein